MTARRQAADRGRPGAAVKGKPKPRKRYAAELKTKVNDASVETFIRSVPDEQQRSDSVVVEEMFRSATKEAPRMWGSAIVGYGTYHYVGKSGREGDWMVCGFSPRKGTLTLYMLGGWDHDKALLSAIGKHSLGKGCLYLRRLDGVDRPALKRLITASLKRAKKVATIVAGEREAT